MKHDITIIICTRNRAESLRPTLESIGKVNVPNGWAVELLVVDNGSIDPTASVVHQSRMPNMELRYLNEPRPGQVRARNTGISAARGEVILFTDDDVRPATDWLEKMAGPLMDGTCEAVVGRIEAAEHLQRAWMTPFHKVWVTIPTGQGETERDLVGANMGFRKSVLARVPQFDPELGPGALGFGDDTLFSWQLCESGCRMCRVSAALIVHHFDPARLLYSQWMADAVKRGRTSAYLLHHWRHGNIRWPLLRYYYFGVKLFVRRQLHPPPPPNEEGCHAWEMSYVCEMEFCRRFIEERKRPRNYACQGLKKKPLST